MTPTITTLGALAGLVVAVVLIVYNAPPFYALVLGAFLGGVIGGGGLDGTISAMLSGIQGMSYPILLILTSGVLVGALIKTNSTERIAESIVSFFGVKRAIPAIAIAAALLCVAGVFVDIALITVAPVALAVGRKANLNKECVLMALLGGGKAGNIVSPNPSVIATAQFFKVELSSLMLHSVVPAVAALLVTITLSFLLARRKNGHSIRLSDVENCSGTLPTLAEATFGPFVTLGLLAARPLFGISIDPIIALPAGGIACLLVTRRLHDTSDAAKYGLTKVLGVSILFLGTGTVAGIISATSLREQFVAILSAAHIHAFMIAPLSGILLSAATGSTTAGATLASQTFSEILAREGVPMLDAATMTSAGATTLNSLPHGSFFLATADATYMSISQRFRLIPYEACVGLTSAGVAILVYLLSV